MSEERREVPAPKALESVAGALAADPGTREGAVPSPSPLGDSEPPRPGGHDSSPAGRRRGRTTLRIPDDEIVRPLPAALDGAARDSGRPPSAPGAPAGVAAAPPWTEPDGVLMPMRIISIDSVDSAPEPPTERPRPPTFPRLTAEEGTRTPLQPSPTDHAGMPKPLGAHLQSLPEEPAPDTDPMIAARARFGSFEPEDIDLARSSSVPQEAPPALVLTELEAEEVRFDEDVLTLALPPIATFVDTPLASDHDRISDPAAEIALEDVVAVEPLPPMRPHLHSPARPASARSLPPSVKSTLVIVPPHAGSHASENSAQRRKGRLWWEDLFNDDYLRTCERLTDEQIAREVDFVEDSLGVERGGAVLDLACGTGRHAVDLARRGYEVVGFDLSLAMLARAGDEAQDREAKLNFVQGDMREMSFDEQFDGVFCWNTSFGFFEEEKNALVIDRIHRSLRAGGLFLLDVVNRDFLVRQSPSLAWFEGDGCVCMDEMSVDFITSRMRVKRTMMLDDGRSREIEYSMRVYSLHELGKILHDHGFKVCEVSGRVATPGVFFGNESPRTIILAEKR
jgi:SAM-dependent methyltransferase